MNTRLLCAAAPIPEHAPPIISGSPPDALVAQAEAKRLAGGISDMTFWRWRQKGIIPEPMKIQNRNFWRRGELIAALLKAAEDPEL